MADNESLPMLGAEERDAGAGMGQEKTPKTVAQKTVTMQGGGTDTEKCKNEEIKDLGYINGLSQVEQESKDDGTGVNQLAEEPAEDGSIQMADAAQKDCIPNGDLQEGRTIVKTLQMKMNANKKPGANGVAAGSETFSESPSNDMDGDVNTISGKNEGYIDKPNTGEVVDPDTSNQNEAENASSKPSTSNEKGKSAPPDDDVIVIDDDDDEPIVSRPKQVRKKSSQAALCKCILCGEMVRLSSLGLHVNSLHSKLIVKGNARIECKVCEQFYNWGDFVDHAQVTHKWSIVKNSATKAVSTKPRNDYGNMKLSCMWCKEDTDVQSVAAHFKSVHKVDEKVIKVAMNLGKTDKTADKSKNALPTGIMGALFVTCKICQKDLKFTEVVSHFQLMHKTNQAPVTAPGKSQTVRAAPTANKQKAPGAKLPLNLGNRQPLPQVRTNRVPPVNQEEQLITLFKGKLNLNLSKSPNYALVKLAHDGKDKVLSIPLSHPIAVHQVHTIAVKGILDDIPALIQSVTDLLASQKPPPPLPVPAQPQVKSSHTPPVGNVKKNVTKTATEVQKNVNTENSSMKKKDDPGTGEKESIPPPGDVGASKQSGSDLSEKEVDKVKVVSQSNETSKTEATVSTGDEDNEEKNEPSKSPTKKGSPRGSLNRLLELQRESIGNSAEEPEPDPSDAPLRRSSRRAKMAARLKIKSVVEKEIADWRKQPELPEYLPSEEEDGKTPINKNVIYVVSNAATGSTTSLSSSNSKNKTIEQYVFRRGSDGKKVLVSLQVAASAGKTTVNTTQSTQSGSRQSILNPVKTPIGKGSSLFNKGKLSTTSQSRQMVQQKTPFRSPVAVTTQKSIAPQQQIKTPYLPAGVTLQSPQIYQQPSVPSGQVVINQVGTQQGSRFIIQPQQQQQQLTIMQPTSILQQGLGGVGNVQVQLQPQTVPVQSPNMMVMQNRLQLVTTPQGQQIILLPSNNLSQQVQPVVVNQVPQNRMIIGSVGAQSTVNNIVTQSSLLNNLPRMSVHQPATVVTSSASPVVRSALFTEKLKATTKPVITYSSTVGKAPLKSVNDLVRIVDLKHEKEGFVCHRADMSVSAYKGVRKVVTPGYVAPVGDNGSKEAAAQARKEAEEDASRNEDFLKLVSVSNSRGSILPADFPHTSSIMFECARCGIGLPTYMLLKTHLAECFDSPPAEEQAYIIRLPFSLLQMFFTTGPQPGGVVSCKLCSKIIPRANSKDLAPLQAHVRDHQSKNTALKGGSVTFGVLSLNKICSLKCSLCGDVILRLWQDVTPMGSHLQTHIKGSAEVLCNQPPVFGLTSKLHPQHISKKAYTWVDYIVPPFTMENPPISEKQNNLDPHVATAGILHHESLLPRRKRRHQTEIDAPKLRGKSGQNYQSNLKPLIIETSTADTTTSYDIRPGKTNLLHSIKSMPSPNKLKRSTLTASIPVKTKHKAVIVQSTGSDRRKIYRQGQYRSARLQEKREKYLKEIDEAAEAGSGSDSPLNPATPVKEQETSSVHPVTCSKSQKYDKPQLLPGANSGLGENTKKVSSATQMLMDFADRQSGKGNDDPKNTSDPVSKKVHVPNPEIPEPIGGGKGASDQPVWNIDSDDEVTEYVEPVMPPRTPSPVKPETPPPPITEGDISDYLQILEGCDSMLKESEENKTSRKGPTHEVDINLSDYFGDSANTSILCEPLIIEQVQAPMYFTRSASTGYRFRCSFSKCETAVPNNTLVMLAHLSQHFRVRIAGDFSQNGSVVGHRRTCKSLPLTINQVAAHFTLSEKEEATLHAGEVQMAYVCQWRNCNRTRTFKKGLITHLYRHVSFHLISEAQHTALKVKSKPLKLSSAQFVPHGSGTKLITEAMQSSHGVKYDKNSSPKPLGLMNDTQKLDEEGGNSGNYGLGSPLASLISRLSKQVMTGRESAEKSMADSKKQVQSLSRAAARKSRFPHQLGPQASAHSDDKETETLPTTKDAAADGNKDDEEKMTSSNAGPDPSSNGKRKLTEDGKEEEDEDSSATKKARKDCDERNKEERLCSSASEQEASKAAADGEEDSASTEMDVSEDCRQVTGEGDGLNGEGPPRLKDEPPLKEAGGEAVEESGKAKEERDCPSLDEIPKILEENLPGGKLQTLSSDDNLTAPPLLLPEASSPVGPPTNKAEMPSLAKSDVPMPDLELVGSGDANVEETVKENLCTMPDLPKLEYKGDT